MRNEHAAPCHRCGARVEALAGYVMGKPGAWLVEHAGCVPVVDPTEYGRPARLKSEGRAT